MTAGPRKRERRDWNKGKRGDLGIHAVLQEKERGLEGEMEVVDIPLFHAMHHLN